MLSSFEAFKHFVKFACLPFLLSWVCSCRVLLQECSGDIIPLMPAMLATPQFVSCTGGEGISSLRKVIYRIGTGGFRTTLPSLQSIAMELPTIYTQIESLVRQLRTHLRSLRTDGEQKPFYTFSELKDRLRRPLKQLSVTGMDFYAALRLLHEVHF